MLGEVATDLQQQTARHRHVDALPGVVADGAVVAAAVGLADEGAVDAAEVVEQAVGGPGDQAAQARGGQVDGVVVAQQRRVHRPHEGVRQHGQHRGPGQAQDLSGLLHAQAAEGRGLGAGGDLGVAGKGGRVHGRAMVMPGSGFRQGKSPSDNGDRAGPRAPLAVSFRLADTTLSRPDPRSDHDRADPDQEPLPRRAALARLHPAVHRRGRPGRAPGPRDGDRLHRLRPHRRQPAHRFHAAHHGPGAPAAPRPQGPSPSPAAAPPWWATPAASPNCVSS